MPESPEPDGYSIDSRLGRIVPPRPPGETPMHAVPISPPVSAHPADARITAFPVPSADPAEEPHFMTTSDRPAPARTGLRGLLSGIGIRVAPGPVEQANRDSDARLRRDEELIRQATWTRAVGVLVANRKGGVGKTPVSLLLAGTLASIRGGSVCVVEVSDDPGSLTFRAEGSPHLGLGELMADVGSISSAGQLAGYTAPQTSFASVIGSVGDRPPLTRDHVAAVAAVIDEYYSIRVMDSGNQSSSSAFDGAIESADALVIPVLNSGDAVLEALALLDRLRRQGGRQAELADRAVILRLNDGRPQHPQVMERINRIIAGAGSSHVFEVPYDSHIAERGQLTLGKLDPATYRVFAATAAAIVCSVKVPAGSPGPPER
ncbi:hypothetical protein E3T61_17145 [Cryobacterium lactosi]|uniref:CobQ/CobB/MinD/ParA nucleotide binding domain-containing protein n=1 Tax=Cryobacterium lactosi TaxID=1259202 RepID=A0A4R9BJA2_9MICO|nr:hypothetical protein [Cryobacterium lactosi]TFD85851.1 hypothetical protein E3T61_17145 [Cryobacterium lactosi]